MLLAAAKNGIVKVLEAPDSEPGTQVIPDKYIPKESQIRIEDFSKIKLDVKDKKVFYNGKPLKTDTEEIYVDISDGAQVR